MPSIDNNHPNYKKLDNHAQYLYAMFNENIMPTLLRNYDRYSMINSVEIRMPFMDYRIVNFVNSLPYSSKIGNGFTKRNSKKCFRPLPSKGGNRWRKTKSWF